MVAALVIESASAWIVDFNNPIVHTQYGSIRGKIDERKTKFNRRPICTFLSIPYARPPVGANRFLVSFDWPSVFMWLTRPCCPTNCDERESISDWPLLDVLVLHTQTHQPNISSKLTPLPSR